MEIAIIGAGNVGRALASSSTRAGHAVTICAATPEHAAAVAREVGATAVGSNRTAVQQAEVVVLACTPQPWTGSLASSATRSMARCSSTPPTG